MDDEAGPDVQDITQGLYYRLLVGREQIDRKINKHTLLICITNKIPNPKPK